MFNVNGFVKPWVSKVYQTSCKVPAAAQGGAACSVPASAVVPCMVTIAQSVAGTATITWAELQASFAGGWAMALNTRMAVPRRVMLLFMVIFFDPIGDLCSQKFHQILSLFTIH
jgi:hypothetical protein